MLTPVSAFRAELNIGLRLYFIGKRQVASDQLSGAAAARQKPILKVGWCADVRSLLSAVDDAFARRR